jgi:hypothetical protein
MGTGRLRRTGGETPFAARFEVFLAAAILNVR